MDVPGQPFHVMIHARPPGVWGFRTAVVDGSAVRVLDIPPERLECPFAKSFEDAGNALAILPRMFIEPDGSFVWVSHDSGASRWQVDGMLFDRNGRLLYVELKGNCPPAALRQLLTACAGSPSGLVVQLVRHAVIVDVEEFCRILCPVPSPPNQSL